MVVDTCYPSQHLEGWAKRIALSFEASLGTQRLQGEPGLQNENLYQKLKKNI